MQFRQELLSVAIMAFCQVVVLAQSAPEDCYRQAAESYRTARWSEAASALADFVDRFPDDARALDARFYLGEALLQAGELKEALASYRAFVKRLGVVHLGVKRLDGSAHTDEPTARFRIGEVAFLLGDRQQAESDLNDFCDRFPRHALVTYALPYLAELALWRGDGEEALRLAGKQLRLGCERPFETHLLMARTYHTMENFEAARGACQQVARNPQSSLETVAKARLIVAQTHAQQNQWRQAVDSYQRLAAMRSIAVADDPTDESPYRAKALLAAAECYDKLGERRMARQACTTVLFEFPRSDFSEQATQRLAELARHPAT
jgi:tetratricopeptide (TPR) repeat protein